MTRTIEEGYRYEIKIAGPEKEVLYAIERINGVKNAVATGERDADSYAYLVESERGIDVRKSLFALCSSRNWAILGLSPVGTDLESIFIRLVDRANGIVSKGKNEKRRKAH